jgi:hypothetical protein
MDAQMPGRQQRAGDRGEFTLDVGILMTSPASGHKASPFFPHGFVFVGQIIGFGDHNF